MSPMPVLITALVLLQYPTHAKRSGSSHSPFKSGAQKLLLRYEWAKACDDEPTNALKCSGVQLKMGRNGEVTVDANCTVTRPTTSWKRYDINITKCNEVVSANTCEYMTTWKFNADVCKMITAPDMLWSSFVAKVNPPVRCPVKAVCGKLYIGHKYCVKQVFLCDTMIASVHSNMMMLQGDYTCRDVTLDAQKIAQLNYPFENKLFVIKASVYSSDDDALHVCTNIGLRLMRVRAA